MSFLIEEEEKNQYPLMLFRAGYPKCKPIDYVKLIDTTQASAQQFLHQLTLQRAELCKLLAQKKPSCSTVELIRVVEKMFPMLMGLNSILKHPGTRLAKGKKLPFAWTSPIHHKDKESFIAIPLFHYELLMMINLLAAARTNRALELMNAIEPDDEEDFDEKAKLAAEQLRMSAGMYDYLARKAIVQWKNPPPETPYECNMTVAGAMRNLCLSAGQAIVVKKAKLHGTSHGTVAKLSVGGFREAEKAFKAVVSMRDEKCVHVGFKDFLHAHAVVHKANALKSLGEACYDDEKYGMAIGYLNKAKETIMKVEKPKEKAHPLYRYKVDIEDAIRIVHHKAELYRQENESIYGKKEIDKDEVEVDQGTLMVKPVPFALPKAKFNMI
eukprot:TRINITY_DN191_c0_g1_i1.p1 TRINITY_DN191_c0_g1~~TRINITY_DN191_c0_g1_i1.p1  ORF type:complete len:397 (-),score=49.87 TRINITY_DN191_c0_g1_i1:31-1179(-)